jgi:hypothetical protein
MDQLGHKSLRWLLQESEPASVTSTGLETMHPRHPYHRRHGAPDPHPVHRVCFLLLRCHPLPTAIASYSPRLPASWLHSALSQQSTGWGRRVGGICFLLLRRHSLPTGAGSCSPCSRTPLPALFSISRRRPKAWASSPILQKITSNLYIRIVIDELELSLCGRRGGEYTDRRLN